MTLTIGESWGKRDPGKLDASIKAATGVVLGKTPRGMHLFDSMSSGLA